MTFAGYLIFGIYTTFFVFMWAKIFRIMKIKAVLKEEGKKQEELIRKLEMKNRKCICDSKESGYCPTHKTDWL